MSWGRWQTLHALGLDPSLRPDYDGVDDNQRGIGMKTEGLGEKGKWYGFNQPFSMVRWGPGENLEKMRAFMTVLVQTAEIVDFVYTSIVGIVGMGFWR